MASTFLIGGGMSKIDWSDITGKPESFTPSTHTHTKSQITDFPTSLKNPTSLTLQFNGVTNQTYDGSSAKTFNVTPSSIGAAASSHTHTKSQITDFPTSLKNPTSTYSSIQWSN